MTNRIQTILHQAGIVESLTFSRASGGQRNETWLCGSYVVRLSLDQNQHTLAQEAKLLKQLACVIPVPTVIAHGRDDVGEWMIQERVEGSSLAHVWSTLGERTQHAAVDQLAEIVQTLHQTSCASLAPPAPLAQALPHDWLTSALPAAVGQLAVQSKSLSYVDHGLMDNLLGYVQALGRLPLASDACDRCDTRDRWGVIHGDLHFDNILWDGQKIVTLLDFEKACYAPLDLELDLFLRYCNFPALFVAEDVEHLTQPEDYRLVPKWFQLAYPQLFDVPYLHQRLGLYSLHYDLTLLQRFPPRGEVDPNEADHLLNRIRVVIEDSSEI